MIVDYPTIFGRPKFLCVKANAEAVRFIRCMLADTLRQLEEAEAKVKELTPEMRGQTRGRTVSSIKQG